MENELNEKILESLDCFDAELFPFIPFLLQDLWEMGSSSKKIIKIITNHGLDKQKLKILDIGCGKGGISIPIAKEFNAEVFGIDAIPEFIDVAKQKARQWNVEDNCIYKCGDAGKEIDNLKGFNLIMLASVGPVLGNVSETLSRLESCLETDGYMVLDDCYLPDDAVSDYTRCLRESEFFDQINNSNFNMIYTSIQSPEDTAEQDEYIYGKIEQRAKELEAKYPSKKYLFESYLKMQRQENYALENELTCITVLLKKK